MGVFTPSRWLVTAPKSTTHERHITRILPLVNFTDPTLDSVPRTAQNGALPLDEVVPMSKLRLQIVSTPRVEAPLSSNERRLAEEVESLLPGQAQDTLRSLRFQAEFEASRAQRLVRKKDRRVAMR